MPSSFIDSVAPIVNRMIELQPKRIVDIGPGWGKYGLLAREYLPNLECIDGVEVEAGRLATQDAIYDEVLVADACRVSRRVWQRYDLALLIDVIEHMSLQKGHEMLWAIQQAGCAVLISTPKVFEEQHDPNNPYETHVSLWDWNEFRPHGIIEDDSTIDSIIYLCGARA